MQSRVFQDFDEFAASVRDIADSKMLLRNVKDLTWSIDSVEIDGIDVQVGKLGSGNIAQGQLRTDGFMLYLPLSEGIQYTANGNVIGPHVGAILEPGCEFCISTQVEHDWCGIFIPNTRFRQANEHFDSILYSIERRCRVSAQNRQTVSQLKAMVSEVMSAAAVHSDFQSTPAAVTAAASIFEAVSNLIGHPTRGDENLNGRPRISRDQIIRNSMRAIEQTPLVPVSVAELSAAADVSERTLRTAFLEYFGIGPARYLMLRRLNRAHAALKMADPDQFTVCEILMDHGEFAFSRFASRYKKLFGALPSETLAQQSRR